MANPTMSQLLQAVRNAVPKISAAQARKLLKDNNIRSEGKIEAATADYKGMTKEQLAEKLGEAGDEEFPEVTGNSGNGKAKRGAAKKTAGAKRAVAKRGGGERRKAEAVTAGPRGFRFGEVWNTSVKNGEGVAFSAANINKLYAHADSLGIAYDKRHDDAASIAKKIARKL